ncbi:MAG: glycosyltransferase [Pseudomonadota bacterium]
MAPTQAHVLLDVSRTVSRLGAGGDSGVDRVERAYVRHFLRSGAGVRFLTRVLGGVALLDPAGMRNLLDYAEDPGALPRPDWRGHIARRQTAARRRAETAVRSLAVAQGRRGALAKLLADHMRADFAYLNVGHLHLEARFLTRLRKAGAGRIGVLVHDTIPLDFPELARPETPKKFEAMLKGATKAADLVIFNSQATATTAAPWLAKWDAAPQTVTAPLGVDPLPLPPLDAPAAGPPSFVMLGTIEPRKNHLFILNLWRAMAADMPAERMPHLHVIGRRGWENENVLDFLDRAPLMGACVFEHGFLPDADMAARLGAARALLFPSFAEGFGYPLAEALQMGVAAICADLPVYREIAAEGPIYLDPLDGPGWRDAILSLARDETPRRAGTIPDLPAWSTHFDTVLKAIFEG